MVSVRKNLVHWQTCRKIHATFWCKTFIMPKAIFHESVFVTPINGFAACLIPNINMQSINSFLL